MPELDDENWDDEWNASGDDGSVPEEDELAELIDKEFAVGYTRLLKTWMPD